MGWKKWLPLTHTDHNIMSEVGHVAAYKGGCVATFEHTNLCLSQPPQQPIVAVRYETAIGIAQVDRAGAATYTTKCTTPTKATFLFIGG